MAQKTIVLTGTVKWAKVHQPDTKFGKKYTLDLYLDAVSWDVFNKSGSRLTVRQDDDGRFVKLVRNHDGTAKGEPVEFGPPPVFEKDGVTRTGVNIGNGSVITCKVEVYDSKYGKGTRLAAVRIDELVEYEPAASDEVF